MAYKINGTTVISNNGYLQNVSAASGPMTINEMPVLDDIFNEDLHIKAGWELYDSKTITNPGSSNQAIFEAPLPGAYESDTNGYTSLYYDVIHIDVLYFRGDETATNRGFPNFQLGINSSSWYSSAVYENKGFDYKYNGTSQGYADNPTSIASYGYTYGPSRGYSDLYQTDHNFVTFSHTIFNANDFFGATMVHTRAQGVGASGENYMSEFWMYPRFQGRNYWIRWREDPSAAVSGNTLSLSYNMYVTKSRYLEERI